MKCSSILLVLLYTLTGILSANTARSQRLDQLKISLYLQNTGIKESLLAVEKQSKISFSLPDDLLDEYPDNISINAGEISVKEAIERILRHTNLTYRVLNNFVVIEEKPVPQSPGSVRGRIVEFETSEPLPGASVRILERNIGMATDERGYYEFKGLPAGEYTLQVSFVSFSTVTQKIRVTAGKETVLDVKLQGDNTLGEVVVEGRVKFNKVPVAYTSDRQLLEEVRTLRAVVSGISNEQIVKTADRNAGEVMRRITGVTVTDERFIEVRGMNQRYNLTYLNGNIAPSTELYNRAFAYDLLPSSVIDRMLVYKSPTAELFGDYAGGAVKIITKDAKPVRHLEVGVQTGYREGTTFDDRLGYRGSGTDWLGFDDGMRRLPASFDNNLGNQAFGSMSNSAAAAAFTSDLQTGTLQAAPDLQVFANYFDNWRLGKGRLFNLTSVTYTNESRAVNQHNQMGNTYRYLTDGEINYAESNNSISQVTQGQGTAKLSALQNLTYRLSPRTDILFKNFFMNEGQAYAYDEISRENTNPALDARTNGRDRTLTLGFQQRTVYSGNLGFLHKFGGDSVLASRLEFNAGYTYARQNVPDQRRLYFQSSFSTTEGAFPTWAWQSELPEYRWRAKGSNIGSEDALRNGMINRLFQQNHENLYNLSADYTLPLAGGVSLKAGTYHFFRDREVSRRFFKVNRAGLTGAEVSFSESPDPIWDRYGDNNRELIQFSVADLNQIWSPRYFSDDYSGLKIYDATSPVDRYVASEQYNAGYVMGDWVSPDERLILNAGVRVERNHIRLAGAVPVGNEANGNFKEVEAEELKTSVLPSLNISYAPSAAWTLRAAYGRTVNRPEIREKAPFRDFDYQNSESIRGNVGLTTAMIDNADLRVEWYPQSGGGNELISIGVFFKSLDNPIEKVRDQNTGFGGVSYPIISFFNANKAEIYGLEAEVRKSLAFLPGTLFRNLSFIGNAALIRSRAYINTADIGLNNNGERLFPVDPELLTFTRRLQGQADYVFNAGLYYENPGWGTKVTAVYNVNGPRVYAASILNPALADDLEARREDGDPFGGYYGTVGAYLATRSNVVELPRHLLNASIQQRIYAALQLRISVQNLLDQSTRLIEDQDSDYRYDREYPVTNDNNEVYYQGDNIFRSFNTGRYYNISLTYSF